MTCAYARGLETAGLTETDLAGLSTRKAAERLGGAAKATSVRNHRNGDCVCVKGETKAPAAVKSAPAKNTEPTPRDHLELGPDGGNLTFHTFDPEPITDWSDVLRYLGASPDAWEVAGDSVRVSRWQQSARTADGDRDVVWLAAYKAQIRPKATALNLDSLVEHVRSLPPNPAKPATGKPVTAVIALADWQLGKSGDGEDGGGTPQTVERVTAGIAAARAYLKAQEDAGFHIERILLANMGDHIEATHGSYASQASAVDLNLRDQLNLALELNMAWIAAMRQYAPVTYTVSLCNHGVLSRVGHDSVMGDSDNAGGFIGDQLRSVCKYSPALADVEFVVPRSEMITTTKVSGVNLAMAHGHKISGKEETWLAAQSQALTHRERFVPDLWLTAHRHHAQVTDFGPYTRIQATTVDPGSKWLYDLRGAYSTPGTTVFLAGDHLPMKWAKYEVLA